MKQQLVLDVILNGEATTYGVQVLFTHGTKQGETPHQKWSFTTITENIENANLELNYFNAEGYEARIVKITTKAEVVE
jgi:hypothetical protein